MAPVSVGDGLLVGTPRMGSFGAVTYADEWRVVALFPDAVPCVRVMMTPDTAEALKARLATYEVPACEDGRS